MKQAKITIRLIYDYNFKENFKIPELSEEDKNTLYWASNYASNHFHPKNGKTRFYWSNKDKMDFSRFAKENL